MSETTEVSPRRETEGDHVNAWAGTSDSTGSAPLSAALERADMALLVVTGLRGGGVRRKVVFTVGAAQRCLDLAAARGVSGRVALVRLAPLLGNLDDQGRRRDDDVQLGGGRR